MTTKKAAPERLTGDELAYHRHVVEEVRKARDAVTRAEAAGESWFGHLMEKYALRQTDIVDAEGVITRTPKETPSDKTLPVEDQEIPNDLRSVD